MITSLFKNSAVSHFVIVLIAIGLWGYAFFEALPSELISITFAHETFELSKRGGIVVSFFATVISGMFLNYRINKFLFSYQPNNLFLLFYLLFFSVELSNSSFLSYDLVSLLLMVFVNYLLTFVNDKDNKNQVFNASFVIGVLCFHNVFFVLFLLLLVHNLSTTKRIGFIEAVLILAGFLMPIFLAISVSILTEEYTVLNTLWQLEIGTPDVSWGYGLGIGLVLVLSFFGYSLVSAKRTGIDIQTLLLSSNLFVYLLFSIVISGLSVMLFPYHYILFLLTLPISLFLSYYFAYSSFKYKEMVFLLVIGLTFFLR